MSMTLFKQGTHKCIMFDDLVTGKGIQSNQFLIVNDDKGAILDPGGQLTYHPLLMQLPKHVPLSQLEYVIASHQDPDIIASLGMWMQFSKAQIVSSRLWSRFLPHLVSEEMEKNIENYDARYISVPDQGTELFLGDSPIILIPAHFLHSVGNFQVYDVKSKILFSGDMGASINDTSDKELAVTDFESHIPAMKSFHRRYMVSNKVCKLWANMIRDMDISMIVPQHGKYFEGKNIDLFLNWISNLTCGIDLVTQENYTVPKNM